MASRGRPFLLQPEWVVAGGKVLGGVRGGLRRGLQEGGSKMHVKPEESGIGPRFQVLPCLYTVAVDSSSWDAGLPRPPRRL